MTAAASSSPNPESRIQNPKSIHVLAPEVAARIAAGEVIERPVSVVRELLDNAVDAGASRITVEIEDGGVALIRVVDDGRGIPPEQVELAFERHATSKIVDLSDLGRVHTLGFRGEALPSIAAAADVEILTRAATEPVGVHAVFIDARVARRSARPGPPGSSLAVRELFGRLPARRKFLASAVAESRQITTLVSHYALAYPEIAFHFVNGKRRALSTSGDGNLRHAFAAIHGAEAGAHMLDVDLEEHDVAVAGLAGPPSLHRGNRAAISVFVNGRWVQSRPLVFAVVDAYETQLPVGRHPVAALSITLPGDEVDVNVHPAKAEVRFRDERQVARVLRHAVSRALESAGPVSWLGRPSPPDRAESAAAEEPPALRARLDPARVAALRPPMPGQARMPLPAVTDHQRGPGHRELLPLLRVVGQLGATYVVAEGPDGMYLIDQHAAHERVVYDRLVAARVTAAPARQPLLEPVVVETDPVQVAVIEEHLVHLASLGVDLEPFGDGAWLLRAVPPGIGDLDIVTAFRSLIDQLAGERRVADPFSRAAATVACHSSVRAGASLAMEEMRRLVEDLERTATPRTCPHGRPTLIHVGTDLIERQFGRR